MTDTQKLLTRRRKQRQMRVMMRTFKLSLIIFRVETTNVYFWITISYICRGSLSYGTLFVTTLLSLRYHEWIYESFFPRFTSSRLLVVCASSVVTKTGIFWLNALKKTKGYKAWAR